MSTTLESRLVELAQAVGADIKDLKTAVQTGTGAGVTVRRVDGGRADTVYTEAQAVDGGGANG